MMEAFAFAKSNLNVCKANNSCANGTIHGEDNSYIIDVSRLKSPKGLFCFGLTWVRLCDRIRSYIGQRITDFIMDPVDYYVNAEWDLTTGNIVFTKDDKWVELKIGV